MNVLLPAEVKSWACTEIHTVTTALNDMNEAIVIGNERTGVPPNVKDWREALALGKPNEGRSSKRPWLILKL